MRLSLIENRIARLRLKLQTTAIRYGLQDQKVISASHKLDGLINMYYQESQNLEKSRRRADAPSE